MEINKELYNEIKDYCQLNGLKTSEFINDILKKAFLREKYGDRPLVQIKKKEEPLKVEKPLSLNEENKEKEVKVITIPSTKEENPNKNSKFVSQKRKLS